MMIRVLFGLLLLLGLWPTQAVQAAACEVQTDTRTHPNGELLGAGVCDANGALKVSGVSGGEVGGTATAAAPTLTEGQGYGFSLTLTGAVRTDWVTLGSGEDQANNLLMTSGGKVKQTTIVSGAVGDATGTAVEVPTGKKVFTATITGAGAVVQVIKLYGGTVVGMVAATSPLLCTINLSGTSGAAGTNDVCIVDAPYSFILPVTSGSTGTPTSVLAMH